MASGPKATRRIERDYQELKQEVEPGHFEGRGWRGLYHRTTLHIAACGFLISERGTISDSFHRDVPGACPSHRSCPVFRSPEWSLWRRCLPRL
jgi:hypothetical protein